MSAWPPFLVDLAPILFGLLVGTLANFGLELDRDTIIPRRKVVAHLMILGLLGLLAWVACEVAHLSTQMRALTSAGAGLLGAKLARKFRDWSEEEADRRLPTREPAGDRGEQP